MTPRFRQARFALVVFAAVATGNAFASLTTYFGAQDAGGAMPTSGAAIDANGAFLKRLVLPSVQTEGFEGFDTSDSTKLPQAPLAIFGSSGASLTESTADAGAGQVTPFDPLNNFGRFNTTPSGSRWWETKGSFTITFATPVNAFGFYGTDWGDFASSFSVALIDTNGFTTTEDLCVSGTQFSCGTTSGSLAFFGFTDSSRAYSSIQFNITQASTGNPDYFGFDDLVIGDLAAPTNNVPEPATLALSGLALAGLAASRRRHHG